MLNPAYDAQRASMISALANDMSASSIVADGRGLSLLNIPTSAAIPASSNCSSHNSISITDIPASTTGPSNRELDAPGHSSNGTPVDPKCNLSRIQTSGRSKSTSKTATRRFSLVSKSTLTHKPSNLKSGPFPKSANDSSDLQCLKLSVPQQPASAIPKKPLTAHTNGGCNSESLLGDSHDTEAGDGEGNSQLTERREQELLFVGDVYTPRWVRNHATHKQGLCELCPNPGRWLQLKNSAFWYHKQFTHGVSSVSCLPFKQPTTLRVVWVLTAVNTPLQTKEVAKEQKDFASSAHIMIEGCCHFCGDWLALMNTKRRSATIQRNLEYVTEAVCTRIPGVASPATLISADEKCTKVQAAILLNGDIAIPSLLASTSSHFTEGVADVEARKGLVPAWYRHASKCHDHQKPRRSLNATLPDDQ
ncbi:hypothetical protein BASA83_002495 [Batrachochytrium salamandrivorans]|nr:hypothetical protein BASA83_002495 [Batrachochytrium salamandrivorans]